ncbi:hypothetical protein, partial [Klebsiella pneumoniae]|uniref:hypothetical protein n=1 Tax=Klebsiella pneumoniae TaxID=573 RepID=UPI003853C618
MRKFAISLAVAALISSSALAQQAQPVTIPASLAQSIYLHLVQGGTAASATRLADDLQDAALAPQREAQL